MDKIALAERLEGFAKVFATENPIAIDLTAMGKVLRGMSDEKFAQIINPEMEEVEAVGLLIPGQGRGQGIGRNLPYSTRKEMEKGHGFGGPKAVIEPSEDEGAVDLQRMLSDPAYKKKIEDLAKMAQEEESEETGKKASWNKQASAAVLQNLVNEVFAMDKTVCCDTKQKLTKEQMPDATKKQETPSTLKTEQTPHLSEALDSDMVAKSKKAKTPKSASKEEEKTEEMYEEREESALKEIAEGLEIAQEGLDKVEKFEEAEKALELSEDEEGEEGEEKEAGKATAEERLEKMEKAQKAKEIKEKSRPSKEAGETIVAEGFEFEASMQELEMDSAEQKKLESLFIK